MWQLKVSVIVDISEIEGWLLMFKRDWNGPRTNSSGLVVLIGQSVREVQEHNSRGMP